MLAAPSVPSVVTFGLCYPGCADLTTSRVQTSRFCHNAGRAGSASRQQERMNSTASNRSRAATVLTDIQFWVPVLVLLGGLLLLKFLH